VLAYANYVAKALVAFAIPVATLLVDLGSDWLGITSDGLVGLSEAQAFAIAVLSGLGVFLKSNAPSE
jgi:hypothetical protein